MRLHESRTGRGPGADRAVNHVETGREPLPAVCSHRPTRPGEPRAEGRLFRESPHFATSSAAGRDPCLGRRWGLVRPAARDVRREPDDGGGVYIKDAGATEKEVLPTEQVAGARIDDEDQTL